MSRVGVEAPTCPSSTKPPAIAVHGLVETPKSASRQLVQGMSKVNESANMPLIYNEVLCLLLPKQRHNKLHVLSLFLSQTAAFGSGMHESNVYFEAIQLRKRLSSCFDWQQLLVHKRIELMLYFFFSCQEINFNCLCGQVLVRNSV